MQNIEFFQGALFVGIILLVFGSAAWFLLVTFLRRFRAVRRPLVPRQKRLRWISWIGACIGTACFLYGYFIEPFWPEITHVQISSQKIKKPSKPIRLVLISDMHSDPQARLEERLPDLIAAQKPDVILFAGDAVNSPPGLPNFKRCFARLSRARSRIDLFCAGHVHGGQVALPFYGALVTLSRFGKQYERGLYHVGSMFMYVSRGIGMEGGVAPRVRFCSRPEITVIDLVPAGISL
jgi:predicted MPP superfamily phosphohydrolase